MNGGPSTPPALGRCLMFLTGRLVVAARDAQMRPTKTRQRRLRSLELLTAACVAEAARAAVSSGPADYARPDYAPPADFGPPDDARPWLEPQPPSVAPPDGPEPTEPGMRGEWSPPE